MTRARIMEAASKGISLDELGLRAFMLGIEWGVKMAEAGHNVQYAAQAGARHWLGLSAEEADKPGKKK